MRETIEQLIALDRFHMKTFYDRVWPLFANRNSVKPHIDDLKNIFNKSKCTKLFYGILRHAFLIELVKLPGVETTKFQTRWCSQLNQDCRQTSFEECLEIARYLIADLAKTWLKSSNNVEILNLFFNYSMLPYELPIDYLSTKGFEKNNIDSRIHRRENIGWVADEKIVRTLKLRKFLCHADTSPEPEFFKKVINDKIKVKTYLTDRVQTGKYKTNREKRWEVHPQSVHFALRRVCLAIEYQLITQICSFDGFPEDSKSILQNEEILPKEMQVFRCPITLERISFQEFKDELMNPIHGKSNFQVGHLNPLKLNDSKSTFSGHTPENVSWISADGNRIQGSMSLDEVKKLLKQIGRNYENEGLI